MKSTVALAFVLLLVFMLLVYYVGLKSDAAAVSSAVSGIGNTFSGRNSSGVLASYPTGG